MLLLLLLEVGCGLLRQFARRLHAADAALRSLEGNCSHCASAPFQGRESEMGCGASVNKDPNAGHPAVKDNWPLKDEAIRIFKLADLDGNECLDSEELAKTLKKPQFVDTAMANYDLNVRDADLRLYYLVSCISVAVLPADGWQSQPERVAHRHQKHVRQV